MSRDGAPVHDEGQRICAGRVSFCSSQVSPESGTRLGTDAPDLDAPTGTMLAPVTLTDSTGVRALAYRRHLGHGVERGRVSDGM